MSKFSQFGGGLRPTQGIVPAAANGWTVAGTWGPIGSSVTQGNPGADTYETLLTINGSGWLDFLGVASLSATSRTITVEVVIDGVTVWTSVSGTVAAASQGRSLLASNASAPGPAIQPLRFNSQLVIKMKDSVGVNAGQAIYYAARTE